MRQAKTCFVPATLPDAEKGDYVKSDNGFYIPVISTKSYRLYKKPELIFFSFKLPRMTYIMTKNLKLDKYYYSNFFYSFSEAKRRKSRLSPQKRLVARLMSEGVNIYTAIKNAYSSSSVTSTANKLIDDNSFLEYYIEITDMKKLQNALTEEGLSYNFVAKHLMSKIEKDQDLDAIRLALNMIKAGEDESSKKKENTEYPKLGQSLYEKKLNS